MIVLFKPHCDNLVFLVTDVVSIDSSSEECVTIEETTEATKDNISVVAMDTSESEEVEISSTIDEVDPCKLLIETIRRDEFGVGVELSEDGRKLMAKQQERLGRSLNRLSKDLYSKDTHFVLELIQNADDNDYSASTKWVHFDGLAQYYGISIADAMEIPQSCIKPWLLSNGYLVIVSNN